MCHNTVLTIVPRTRKGLSGYMLKEKGGPVRKQYSHALAEGIPNNWAVLEGMNLKCSDFFLFQLSLWQAGSRRLNTRRREA